MYILYNGNFYLENEAVIKIQDRGFKFGDGIFETLRINNYKPYNLSSHLSRLETGLKTIFIDFDLSILSHKIDEIIAINQLKTGFIRISITRGEESSGYLPMNSKPNYAIESMEYIPASPKLENLMISSYTKPSLRSIPVNCKLMQGMNSSLAIREARQKGYLDAILLNDDGIIAETSSANIFWVNQGIIYTPKLQTGALAGTIRSKLIESKLFHIKEIEEKIEILKEADEVFITNVRYLAKNIAAIAGIKEFNQNLVSNKILDFLKLDLENDTKKTS